MLNPFSNRSHIAGICTFVFVILLGFTVHFFQSKNTTVYESTYPGIMPSMKVSSSFNADEVILALPQDAPPLDSLVVFVYAADGSQYGMIKKVRNGTIRITGRDYPEYQAVFRGAAVEGYRIFRRVNGKADVTDFLTLLQEAKIGNLRFGVQQCMYPVCTHCLVVCPVISKGVIEIHQTEGGQIVPVVLYGGCPRSGKCFAVCTLGAFYKADLRHVQSREPNTLKLETVLEPRVLQ